MSGKSRSEMTSTDVAPSPLSKRILWTERLYQLIPVGKESGSFASFLAVRFVRSLTFTLILVLISIPPLSVIGVTTHAFDAITPAAPFYLLALLFLVFVVSGWFNKKWDWFFSWSSHILNLSQAEFGKFRDRREKFVKSSSACLIVTLILYVLTIIPFLAFINREYAPLMLRPEVFLVYLAFSNFFLCLLIGTLLWIIVSMWITFNVTLRQPLNLKLSPRIDEEFRPLAIWSLKALFVTFVLVAVIVVFVNLGVIIMVGGFASYLGTLMFLVTLGVLAFLLPFYHVHRVLTKLKNQELLEIEKEHDRIIQELAGTTPMQGPDTEARMMYLINSIISLEVLHIRESRAKDADVWPIDTTILSAAAGLVLIPIVVNIITNLI